MTAAAELVRRSRAAQGLPLVIEDLPTLQRVAAILTPTASLAKNRPAAHAGRSPEQEADGEAGTDTDYQTRA